MKTKVTVTIADRQYTLVGTEEESYVQQLAQQVNTQLTKVIDEAHIALADAAVLTAVNFADELAKERKTQENLRLQLKDALEDAAKAKTELSDAKREIFKLQNKR